MDLFDTKARSDSASSGSSEGFQGIDDSRPVFTNSADVNEASVLSLGAAALQATGLDFSNPASAPRPAVFSFSRPDADFTSPHSFVSDVYGSATATVGSSIVGDNDNDSEENETSDLHHHHQQHEQQQTTLTLDGVTVDESVVGGDSSSHEPAHFPEYPIRSTSDTDDQSPVIGSSIPATFDLDYKFNESASLLPSTTHAVEEPELRQTVQSADEDLAGSGERAAAETDWVVVAEPVPVVFTAAAAAEPQPEEIIYAIPVLEERVVDDPTLADVPVESAEADAYEKLMARVEAAVSLAAREEHVTHYNEAADILTNTTADIAREVRIINGENPDLLDDEPEIPVYHAPPRRAEADIDYTLVAQVEALTATNASLLAELNEFRSRSSTLETEVLMGKGSNEAHRQIVAGLEHEVKVLKEQLLSESIDRMSAEKELNLIRVDAKHALKRAEEMERRAELWEDRCREATDKVEFLENKIADTRTSSYSMETSLDRMLASTMNADRADLAEKKEKEARDKLQVVEARLKELQTRLDDLQYERMKMVPEKVHISLLQLAEERALSAEKRALSLEHDVSELKKRMTELGLNPDEDSFRRREAEKQRVNEERLRWEREREFGIAPPNARPPYESLYTGGSVDTYRAGYGLPTPVHPFNAPGFPPHVSPYGPPPPFGAPVPLPGMPDRPLSDYERLYPHGYDYDPRRDVHDPRDPRNFYHGGRDYRNPRDEYDRHYDPRDPYAYRDSRSDPRDARDQRDPRDPRSDPRDQRDPRDLRSDPRDARDFRDNRDNRDSRDSRDSRELSRDNSRESRDSRESSREHEVYVSSLGGSRLPAVPEKPPVPSKPKTHSRNNSATPDVEASETGRTRAGSVKAIAQIHEQLAHEAPAAGSRSAHRIGVQMPGMKEFGDTKLSSTRHDEEPVKPEPTAMELALERQIQQLNAIEDPVAHVESAYQAHDHAASASPSRPPIAAKLSAATTISTAEPAMPSVSAVAARFAGLPKRHNSTDEEKEVEEDEWADEESHPKATVASKIQSLMHSIEASEEKPKAVTAEKPVPGKLGKLISGAIPIMGNVAGGTTLSKIRKIREQAAGVTSDDDTDHHRSHYAEVELPEGIELPTDLGTSMIVDDGPPPPLPVETMKHRAKGSKARRLPSRRGRKDDAGDAEEADADRDEDPSEFPALPILPTGDDATVSGSGEPEKKKKKKKDVPVEDSLPTAHATADGFMSDGGNTSTAETPKKPKKKKDLPVEVAATSAAEDVFSGGEEAPKKSKKKKDLPVEVAATSAAEDVFSGGEEAPKKSKKKKDLPVEVPAETAVVEEPVKKEKKKKTLEAESIPAESVAEPAPVVATPEKKKKKKKDVESEAEAEAEPIAVVEEANPEKKKKKKKDLPASVPEADPEPIVTVLDDGPPPVAKKPKKKKTDALDANTEHFGEAIRKPQRSAQEEEEEPLAVVIHDDEKPKKRTKEERRAAEKAESEKKAAADAMNHQPEKSKISGAELANDIPDPDVEMEMGSFGGKSKSSKPKKFTGSLFGGSKDDDGGGEKSLFSSTSSKSTASKPPKKASKLFDSDDES